MSYTVDGTNVSAGTTATLAQYQSTYLLAGASNWQIQYYCVSNVSSYVEGTYISATDFSALTSEEQKSFEKRYVCQKDYSVTGSNSKTVAINEIITAEEYNQLISLEQNYFLPSEYLDYSNKKLKIDINVYTKANISSTNKTSGYYTEDHYFKNYVQSQNSSAYSYWLEYKQASSANGVVSVPQNRVLVYNGHGTFETGIPYSYDFAASEDITNSTARAGNVSAYVYDENDKFYAYAGGNKFNDGIGVYYLAKNSGSIKVSVSANWYNSRGEALSGVSINTINIAVSNDWVEISDS
ncbi:MAG: hypothetical protein IJX26_02060, partial [Clostridia bacterium]|nr:hypothetical protein [Clostridia bacterium]